MTIPNHDANLLPPDDGGIGPCRECPDSMEDHDWDAENGAWACQIDGCECDDGAPYTDDDRAADEADDAWDEYKSGGF